MKVERENAGGGAREVCRGADKSGKSAQSRNFPFSHIAATEQLDFDIAQ